MKEELIDVGKKVIVEAVKILSFTLAAILVETVAKKLQGNE